MTVKEFNEFLDEMREKGYTDQMILIVLYSMYANHEFTTEEYENLIMSWDMSFLMNLKICRKKKKEK